jgi:FOG: FHA domain
MDELRLKFIDQNGESRLERVSSDRFVIGRYSECDLCIPDGRLSREHVEIERIGYNFIVSDLGSSNGTTLNGTGLSGRVALNNGDRLNLGGGIEMTVEIAAKETELPANQAESPGLQSDFSNPSGSAPVVHIHPEAQKPEGGFPMAIFLIAPILGLIVIALVGGAIYIFSSGTRPEPINRDDVVYASNDNDDIKVNKKSKDPKSDPSGTPLNEETNTTPSDTPNIPPLPSPKDLGDTGKSEQDAAVFLRNIAQNDPTAFLTGEQAKLVNDKIKQVSSPALADNIASARKSSAEIKALAESKNLKPQFLAAAAITKLGSSRGDVLQTARGMAETFEKLRTPVGNELANEALLMVAAYDQGAAGDFLKMRNMLQDIATKYPESSRAIRTIWFLHKNNKISDGEYDLALRFLAVGTVMQNPKDFGVNTEALAF